ncbi:MAG: GTP-binding protein [Chloroflexota bacterium]|nr:GTP-binding protein [Chloroflexota bacterium]
MFPLTEGRMKLTVLGGFLGSGKTTWLRHQLHQGLLKDAFVIVNEAADVPVDDLLLGGSTRLAVLAGGCACCETLDQLIEMLRGIADSRVGASGSRLERLVLETSGLADPGRIVEAIRADPVLVYHIVVSETVVAVDAVYGLDQLRSEPLGRRQVEVADRLVVTKIEETAPDSLTRLLATLRSVNPGAEISGAVLGSPQPLPDFSGVPAEPLPDTDGVAATPIFATKLVLDETIDWTAFSVWLSALIHVRGDDVMRVKGVVRTPAGRLLLQSVRRAVQSPEILPDGDDPGHEDGAVVVIGRGYQAEDLSRSLRRFANLA